MGLLPQAEWPFDVIKLIAVGCSPCWPGDGWPAHGAGGTTRPADPTTLALAVDISLTLLVLAVAGWIIAVRDTFAAVIGFVAYGLLLALIWVRLAAPDVALTEAAIGGGPTGALLIGAAGRLRKTEAATRAEYPGVLIRTLAAILAVTVTAGACRGGPGAARSRAHAGPAAVASLATTGVGNPVTAVLPRFAQWTRCSKPSWCCWRCSACGRWRPTAPGAAIRDRDTLPIPTASFAHLARLLPPIGVIVGLYIFWIGADLPGGKFQGATILAAMWLWSSRRARRHAAD